jgi:ABC-type transport system substrate-binding protein
MLTNPAAAETGKTVLKIGIDSFPVSMNPVYATNEISMAIVNKMYDALYYFDAGGKIRKGVVERDRVETTKENIHAYIQLKKNIFFSNGKELDAGDVVKTVKLLGSDAFQYPYMSDIHFIKEIQKTGRYSLKLTFSGRAAWRTHLTFKLLNSGEIEGVKPAAFREMSLSGTGPYRIKEIERPVKITLELNPRHLLGGAGRMYRFLEYSVVSYPQLAPLKLVKQEIDICELQPEAVKAYKGIKQWQRNFDILKYKKFGYSYLVFNLRNARVSKELRNLCYNLLVYGNFTARFLNGRGEQVYSPFLLLSDTSVPSPRPASSFREKATLRILTNSESKIRKEFVLFLAQELKSYNIHLEPIFLEYHSFLEYLKKGRFDMALSGFLLDIDYNMLDIFHSGSGFNYAGFRHRGMDMLLERGLQETDLRKRREIYRQAHRIWLEELPLLPLFNLFYYVGVSKDVKVPEVTYRVVGSTGDFLFNIHQWEAQ